MPVYIKTEDGTDNVVRYNQWGSSNEKFHNTNMIMRGGYKEITDVPGVDTIPLFNLDELSEMMGVTITDPYKVIVLTQNANSSFQDVHTQACGYYATRVYNNTTYNNVWTIRLDRAVSGKLAVTYVVIYYTDEGTTCGAYIKTNSGVEALQTGYNTGEIKRIVVGTSVVTLSGNNSYAIHNETSMNNLVGAQSNEKRILCYYNNGDGGAQSAHIDGGTFVPSDGTWRITLTKNTTATGPFRVNWLVFRW